MLVKSKRIVGIFWDIEKIPFAAFPQYARIKKRFAEEIAHQLKVLGMSGREYFKNEIERLLLKAEIDK